MRGDDAMADQLEASGDVEVFVDRWLSGPMFNRLTEAGAADRRERLRNGAEGLASSLRLCGTGTQVPSWDRLASAQLARPGLGGDRRRPLRRPCRACGPPCPAWRGLPGPRWRTRRPPCSACARGAPGVPLAAGRRSPLSPGHRSTPRANKRPPTSCRRAVSPSMGRSSRPRLSLMARRTGATARGIAARAMSAHAW